MSYGLMTSGYNTYTVVTSEGKSLVYADKATRQTGSGDTYYIQDNYTQIKRYDRSNISTDFSQVADGSDSPGNYAAWTGYGRFDLWCHGQDLSCGTASTQTTMPDETGYWTYQINSLDSIPTIFIHSSDINYSAAIISIYQIPSTSNYTLKVLVSFPSGQRSSTEVKLSIYCFHTKAASATTGFGMEIYDSSGNVSYNTDQHPAVIGDILSITAIGGTLSAPTETSSFLSSPPEAASAMSKPAFLSMDWVRPVRTYVSPTYTVQDRDFYGCDDNEYYKMRVIQPFVGSGFNIKSDGSARLHITGVNVSEYDGGISTSNTSGDTIVWNTMPLPISVPIIDGADYD